MSITLDESAFRSLQNLAVAYGGQKRVMSRIASWVASQGNDMQAAILTDLSEEAREEIFRRWVAGVREKISYQVEPKKKTA